MKAMTYLLALVLLTNYISVFADKGSEMAKEAIEKTKRAKEYLSEAKIADIAQKFSHRIAQQQGLGAADELKMIQTIIESIKTGKEVVVTISNNRVMRIGVQGIKYIVKYGFKVLGPIVVGLDLYLEKDRIRSIDDAMVVGTLSTLDFLTYTSLPVFLGREIGERGVGWYWDHYGIYNNPEIKKILAEIARTEENIRRLVECLDDPRNLEECFLIGNEPGQVVRVTRDDFQKMIGGYENYLDATARERLNRAFIMVIDPRNWKQSSFKLYLIHKKAIELEMRRRRDAFLRLPNMTERQLQKMDNLGEGRDIFSREFRQARENTGR